MDRFQVSSTTIASVGFDPDSNTLEIEFTSGQIYRYSQVPVEVFLGLVNADSIGRYFNDELRDVYPFTRSRR